MQFYQIVLYVSLGLLPSLVWLFYYLKKDIHPEPKKIIIAIFLLGAISTVFAFFAETGLMRLFNSLQAVIPFVVPPLMVKIITWFLIVALIEELFKFSVVKLFFFRSRDLDEPLDIMLYMVVAALGFAAAENMLYLFAPINGTSFDAILQTALLLSFARFTGATFLHTLCSALVGYFLVLGSLRATSGRWLTLVGMGLATFLHGLYNFSIIELSPPFIVLIPVMILAGLAFFIMYDFDEVKKIKGICKLK